MTFTSNKETRPNNDSTLHNLTLKRVQRPYYIHLPASSSLRVLTLPSYPRSLMIFRHASAWFCGVYIFLDTGGNELCSNTPGTTSHIRGLKALARARVARPGRTLSSFYIFTQCVSYLDELLGSCDPFFSLPDQLTPGCKGVEQSCRHSR